MAKVNQDFPLQSWWLAVSHSRTKNGEENMCKVAG
jgi:hypothetical protein